MALHFDKRCFEINSDNMFIIYIYFMVSVSDKVFVGPHFVVTVFTEPDVALTAGRPSEFAWHLFILDDWMSKGVYGIVWLCNLSSSYERSQPFHGTFLSTYHLHYKQNRIPKGS